MIHSPLPSFFFFFFSPDTSFPVRSTPSTNRRNGSLSRFNMPKSASASVTAAAASTLLSGFLYYTIGTTCRTLELYDQLVEEEEEEENLIDWITNSDKKRLRIPKISWISLIRSRLNRLDTSFLLYLPFAVWNHGGHEIVRRCCCCFDSSESRLRLRRPRRTSYLWTIGICYGLTGGLIRCTLLPLVIVRDDGLIDTIRRCTQTRLSVKVKDEEETLVERCKRTVLVGAIGSCVYQGTFRTIRIVLRSKKTTRWNRCWTMIVASVCAGFCAYPFAYARVQMLYKGCDSLKDVVLDVKNTAASRRGPSKALARVWKGFRWVVAKATIVSVLYVLMTPVTDGGRR